MKLNICFQESTTAFPVTFIEDNDEFEVRFEDLQIIHIHDADYYSGDTFVVPDFVGTILQTKGKVIRENIVVIPIQVNTVSNPQGGYTVNIGGYYG